jgi:L-seryl-tRNA(Ser) seleniumtransferase
MRVDKLTLAALEATLALYRDPETVMRTVPTLAMLTATHSAIHARAIGIAARMRSRDIAVTVVDTEASVGGGAYPTARIPSAALALTGDAVALESRLRGGRVPVIGRIADGTVLLDLRSVPVGHDEVFADTLIRTLS